MTCPRDAADAETLEATSSNHRFLPQATAAAVTFQVTPPSNHFAGQLFHEHLDTRLSNLIPDVTASLL